MIIQFLKQITNATLKYKVQERSFKNEKKAKELIKNRFLMTNFSLKLFIKN